MAKMNVELKKIIDELKLGLKEKLQVYLKIKVRPNAPSSQFVKLDNDSILVDIKAVPQGGKANTELIRMISKQFHVLAKNVKIISGAGERVKLIKISLK